MQANPLRAHWAAGKAVINGWLNIPNSWTAELMAHMGFDSLTIDMQHGLTDLSALIPMLQATTARAIPTLVRCTWNEPGQIMRILDSGAYGIICPMVNTRAEAEAFVGACRYAPHGYRSAGPARARMVFGSDYVAGANAFVLTFAMIETAQAVANMDEIMSTPGLDGIYIGPADLSLSHGKPPTTDLTDPDMLALVDRILAAAKSHGIIAGIHTASAANALKNVAKGFRFVTAGADNLLLQGAADALIKAVRAG